MCHLLKQQKAIFFTVGQCSRAQHVNRHGEAFHSCATAGSRRRLSRFSFTSRIILENICIYLQHVSCHLHGLSDRALHLLVVAPAASCYLYCSEVKWAGRGRDSHAPTCTHKPVNNRIEMVSVSTDRVTCDVTLHPRRPLKLHMHSFYSHTFETDDNDILPL